MPTQFVLKLYSPDVFQILDALESRAESWEKTARHLEWQSLEEIGEGLETENTYDSWEDFFIAEECNNPAEAWDISRHFREIINTISDQIPSTVPTHSI